MGLEFGRWAHLPREIHAVGAAPPPTRPQSRTCLQGARVRFRVKARVGVGVRGRVRVLDHGLLPLEDARALAELADLALLLGVLGRVRAIG